MSKLSERNILIAFILNLSFSIYEFVGGAFTGSTAIMSDAVHDLGDATSIGISYFLERKSKRRPDSSYTYGYIRYSLVGGMITTLILLLGSAFVISNAIQHIIHPVEINYDGMIILAIIGAVVNFIAAYFTREGDSLNQKSVNLHMLEDVLGWIVVLVGAIVMRFTNFALIDPILSIFVAVYILIHAWQNFRSIIAVFLEKTPSNISIPQLEKSLLTIKGIENVHHIHVWSMDGYHNYATMHVVSTAKDPCKIKSHIRSALQKYHINHTTIELEAPGEACTEHDCTPPSDNTHMHSHSHSHSHSHMHSHHHQ